MLDEKSVIPLYYQLKEIIKEKIIDGTWKEGDKVPSEREIVETYNISRATVRKALDELLIEGFIERKQGIGTFIAKSKILENLTGELSFAKQAINQGYQPHYKIIQKEISNEPFERILKTFKIKESDKIFKLLGVFSIDGEPVILSTFYIPSKIVPNISKVNLEQTYLYVYLENEYNLKFTHSTFEIEPVLINEFEANHLNTYSGQPALLVERVFFIDEQAIAIQKRIIRGDKCKYMFTLDQNNRNRVDYDISLKFNKTNS